MRVLIEAHHPAHIHFWKYPIRELQARGHQVLVIGRKRDVMERLLAAYPWIDAVIPNQSAGFNRFPIVGMFCRQAFVANTIRKFKPDVVASLMGSYTQSAKLLGGRHLIFTDSEFQHLNHRIAHPFADEIYTPECFYKELGPKQKRYRGIHELMFLAHTHFKPDLNVLKAYGDLEAGRYILIRLSAWNTLHDVGHSGVGGGILQLIRKYEDQFRFIISAEESKVLPELKPYVVEIQPEQLHELIYYSAFVVSEGASTASEAACLGVPTVYINSTEERGYLRMLESEFNMVHSFRNVSEGLADAELRIQNLGAPDWQIRESQRRAISNANPDGVNFVVDVLEGNRKG